MRKNNSKLTETGFDLYYPQGILFFGSLYPVLDSI